MLCVLGLPVPLGQLVAINSSKTEIGIFVGMIERDIRSIAGKIPSGDFKCTWTSCTLRAICNYSRKTDKCERVHE